MTMKFIQKGGKILPLAEGSQNNMSTSTTLRIQNPPQYDVTIETDFQQSIFLDMYRGAARNVDAIIKRNKELDDRRAGGSCWPVYPEESINTAIAFVGGRGTGKSSAMQSFSNYLQTGPKKDDGVWRQDDETDIPKFVALPTIDSSQISEHETVIGRMSAAMLTGFRKEQKNLSLEKRQEFIGCAKEVNELAVLLQTGEWFKCGDKLLTNTERICGMKASVRKLVDSYLSIVCKEKAYLIITIDDLDMGIQSAYAIMEEIRQYLSIPHVVVLVSIDETLLDAVVRTSINESMKVSDPDKDHKALVKDLSYRYLEKLFPVNRRHHTPRLTSKQLREWNIDICREIFMEEPHTVLNVVLHLIWRKTMLIPVCNRDGDHLLIPHNLRSLCHMVVLLRNLPDIAYGGEDGKTLQTYENFRENQGGNLIRENLRHNLNVFGKYIVNNLASYGAPQLNTKDEADMAEVLEAVIHQMQEVPLSRMNAMIIGHILHHVGWIAKKNDFYRQILGKVARPEQEEDKHYDMLSPAIRYPDSISLGDVMFVLGMLDSRSKCTYVRYLVEVIRILWSIRMTEEFYVNGTTEDAEKTNISYGITNDFRCAVGGSFVNPDYADFVENGGWMKYDDISKEYSAEMARPLVLYRGSANFQTEAWRLERSEGGSYYKVDSLNDNSKIWCNPFAVHSRLLSKTNASWDTWKRTHIMALPFYSFDFVYRYYEIMHEQFRAQEDICSFWTTLAILLRDESGAQVVLNSLMFQGMPKEKKLEITGSLDEANKKLREEFKAVGDQFKNNTITTVSELLAILNSLRGDPVEEEKLSQSMEAILQSMDNKEEMDSQISMVEKNAKEKIDELFVFNKTGFLTPEIIWPAKEPSEVYLGYDEAKTLREKIKAAEEIKSQIKGD